MPLLALAAPPLPVSDPLNTNRWTLNATVSDEFDGQQLDLKKWNNLGREGNYFGQWKGHHDKQTIGDKWVASSAQ